MARVTTFPRVILMNAPPEASARRAHRSPDAVVINLRTCSIQRGATAVRFPPHSTAPDEPTQLFRVVSALIMRRGGPVSSRDLCDWLWSDDPDGGPLHAIRALSFKIYRARDRLLALDLDARFDAYGIGHRIVDLRAAQTVREAA